MASKYFEKVVEKISPEAALFTKKSLDIVDRIYALLEQKGMSQRDLAEKLDKKESEISRWLSPGHNLTLKSIVKLEIALGERILTISEEHQPSEEKTRTQ